MANVKVISEWHSQRTDFLDFVELLKKGDLVEFSRAGYCHWAVYIGEQGALKVGDIGFVL